MRTLRLAHAQINCTIGDLAGNTEKIITYLHRARNAEADLVSFPELCITGYPPEDLLFKPEFIRVNLECLRQIEAETKGITAIVGFVDRNDDIYNAAAILHDGKLVDVYHKMYLPNYGVFDEQRYFQAGDSHPVYVLDNVLFGVNICEDIWYPGGPALVQALGGNAELIININASPYHAGKRRFRAQMLATRANDCAAIVAYNNMVGGQDELVFDGNSMVFDQRGHLICEGPQFEEDLLVVDLDIESVFRLRLLDPRRRQEKQRLVDARQLRRIELPALRKSGPKSACGPELQAPLEEEAEILAALRLGLRDYVQKNRFRDVVLGLSGGIDSALVAVIAVQALGAENVTTVAMPSRYTSEGSLRDAHRLAETLGNRFLVISIEETFRAYLEALEPHFAGRPPDLTEENVQARIRGNLLMALSNKFGSLVLTTGNKSETSVGYCTLYGDMAGGFAVIQDIPKTLVYRLAQYLNATSESDLIPKEMFEKAPSAELRENQKDEDSLPPYGLLDPILKAYVEEEKSLSEILQLGFERGMAERVITLVDGNEYKRRQAPPGIKITPKAFGRDRRLPITNRFRSR